jgi:hypothetical protein
MRWIASLAICAPLVACGPTAQPESAKTVAAFEVPLSSEADRSQFLAVLRAAAAPEGMHVDAENSENLKAEAKVGPNFEMTMKAAVWRGVNDDEAVASAMDQFDHLGHVLDNVLAGKRSNANEQVPGERDALDHASMAGYPIPSDHADRSDSAGPRPCSDTQRLRSQSNRGAQVRPNGGGHAATLITQAFQEPR